MNPQRTTLAAGIKRFLQLSLCILAFIFVVRVMLVPSTAQSTTDERELEDKIPKHLPIKVKLKKEKEKAFKDMKNEKWARAIELEVTNTGDKPIYSLSFILEMPEITSGGFPIVFDLYYGSVRMRDFKNKPEPDDISIKPGETYVLKLFPGSAQAFEESTVEENWPNPKKIILVFQRIGYGDGTGFEGTTGVAVSYPQNQQSRSDDYKPPHKSTCKSPQGPQAAFSDWADTFEILPASFSPVNFLSIESSQPSTTTGTAAPSAPPGRPPIRTTPGSRSTATATAALTTARNSSALSPPSHSQTRRTAFWPWPSSTSRNTAATPTA